MTIFLTDHISTRGDIILGGLFPVHKEGGKENICGTFNEIPGYQYMESMLYAVENINRRDDILPGIKLGTLIYDTHDLRRQNQRVHQTHALARHREHFGIGRGDRAVRERKLKNSCEFSPCFRDSSNKLCFPFG